MHEFGQARTVSVANLLPPVGQAVLFRDVTIWGDIQCHLATAHASAAQRAIITNKVNVEVVHGNH